MPEIGTRDIIPDELNNIIKDNFSNSNTIAVLERWYCNGNEDPDFFNYLSKPHGKESDWNKGRVFDNISEIRWESEKGVFHLVWIKDDESIPDEWVKEKITFSCKREIMLWGTLILKKLNPEILLSGSQIIDKNEWFEKQVPRIFDYPAKGNGTHVYAILNEYCIGDDSKVYRFKEVISK